MYPCLVAALPFLLLPVATRANEVQWSGQSALKIVSPGGKVLAIDPFIVRIPKAPEAQKDLARLGKVDLILVTHGHGDHVGDTAALAARRN